MNVNPGLLPFLEILKRDLRLLGDTIKELAQTSNLLFHELGELLTRLALESFNPNLHCYLRF